MPNEILLAGIGDLVVAEAVTGEYLLLLTERGALPAHPALYYAGAIDGRGSNVIKVRHAGLLGYDLLSETADGGTVPNTPFSDGSTTITVVRQSKAYEASDMARMTGGDIINPANFAADAVQSQANTLTALVADVVDGFTAQVGSTGVDLDTSVVLAATGSAIVANAPGPWMGMLHGQQWSDLIQDAGLVAGGALQWLPATAELTRLRGTGYQGQWLGVDWFASNRVVTANGGADRAGAVWGRGGVLWGDGTPPLDDPARQMLVGNKLLFEVVRNGTAGGTQFVSHAYFGASKGLETGVTIISDA